MTAVRRYLDPDAPARLAGMPAPRRALFLDRDGVVNRDLGYVHRSEQVEWVPGIFTLCAGALQAGYLPVVVTNQAGIARGYYAESTLLEFSAWMHAEFARRGAALLATYYCPHHPQTGLDAWRQECDCRKPKPGMLLAAAGELAIDLAGSLLVGDTASDIEAAHRAGVGQAVLFSGGELPAFPALTELPRQPRICR